MANESHNNTMSRRRSDSLRKMREQLEREERENQSNILHEIAELLYLKRLFVFCKPVIDKLHYIFARFGQLIYMATVVIVFFVGFLYIINNLANNKKAIFIGSLFSRVQYNHALQSYSINQRNPEQIVQEFVQKASDAEFEDNKEDFEKTLRQSNNFGDSAELLQVHPDPSLVEPSEDGLLPIINSEGQEAWQIYSRPYDVLDERNSIAIIINNLGLSYNQYQLALGLPSAVSLSLSPYTNNIKELLTDSRNRGHEVFLNIPMEPTQYPNDDPGPLGLLTQASEEELILQLRKTLGKTTGYVGLVPIMGSDFLRHKESLTTVLQVLKKRGVAFLDANTTLSSVSASVMSELDSAGAQVDIAITETVVEQNKVEESLADAVKLAKKNGNVIILVQPYANLLKVINRWVRTLYADDISLLPVSAIIERRARNR